MPGPVTTDDAGTPAPPATRVARPVAAAVLLAMLTLAVYAFAAFTPAGRYLDGPPLAGGRLLLGDAVRPVLWVVLDAAAAGPLVVAAVLAVRTLVTGRRVAGERDRVAVATVLAAGTCLVALVLKHVLVRPGEPNTLPSGHTTAAATGVVALVLLLPPARRLPAVLAGAAYAAALGTGTVLVGWHRPSDVLAAYLVTGTGTALALALARRRGLVAGLATGRVPPAIVITLGVVTAVALPAAAAVLARLLVLGRDGLGPGDRVLAFAACAAGNAGTVALLAAALLVLPARPATPAETTVVPTLDIEP